MKKFKKPYRVPMPSPTKVVPMKKKAKLNKIAEKEVKEFLK